MLGDKVGFWVGETLGGSVVPVVVTVEVWDRVWVDVPVVESEEVAEVVRELVPLVVPVSVGLVVWVIVTVVVMVVVVSVVVGDDVAVLVCDDVGVVCSHSAKLPSRTDGSARFRMVTASVQLPSATRKNPPGRHCSANSTVLRLYSVTTWAKPAPIAPQAAVLSALTIATLPSYSEHRIG